MRIAPLFMLLGVVGCGDDPCAAYADYMCDCHPEEDCDDLQTIYGTGSTDADLAETCAADLQEQQEEDDAENYATSGECGTAGGDDTAA